MKQELKKVFTDIMEYQMNYVQLARTTEPYKLAERGLKLLEECEVNKLSKADVIKSVCKHEWIESDKRFSEADMIFFVEFYKEHSKPIVKTFKELLIEFLQQLKTQQP